MLVHALVINHQSTDSDDWNHWVDEHIVSYHMRRESAVDELNSLIDKELDRLDEQERNSGRYKEYYDSVNDNFISYEVGTNGEQEFHPMYFIKEIEVKD